MGTKGGTSKTSKATAHSDKAERAAKKRKDEGALAEHVANTVETIAAMHARAQREVSPHVRRISALTATLGHLRFSWASSWSFRRGSP